MKKLFIAVSAILVLLGGMETMAQNVGIGTSTPVYKLDVAGRMRIRHEATSAGVWLDASNGSNRAFIGMVNDEHVGMYGNVAGWRLAMNVSNGNVGVGNSNPSASLDVLGTLKYRGSAFPNLPEPGALLTSIDDAGNAQWQRPVVFKTNGLSADITVPGWQWTKINFASSNLEVNEGFYYDPFNSRFNAPVRGIYHFDSKIFMLSSKAKTYFRMVVVRNGSVVKEYRDQEWICDDFCTFGTLRDYKDFLEGIWFRSLSISVDTPLEKNDQVWLEAYASDYKENDGTSIDGTLIIKKEAHSTWFGGHLVYRY